ncbi:MAG: tetratricopeptide repeat protein [Acetobacteraceae bacterium]
MTEDAQGHAWSGATAESVALFDEAVRAFTLVHGDTVGLLDSARAAAPGFAMAHLAKAWVFAMANDPVMAEQGRGLLRTLGALALNAQEQAHYAALSHALEGHRAAAVTVLDRLLMQYPHDLIAHQAAALLDGFLGRFPQVRARSARAMPAWAAHQPNYGIMLSFLGFGLEEAGDYARAEEIARQAAELEPLGFWPHHTVAHVMEMTGRPEDGLGWMVAREPLWSTPAHANQVHIWWHKALFHVELGQFDAALALYDGPIRATQRRLAISLTNASALLWRLWALGHDVGSRWDELAALWSDHADGRICVFADVHAAMAELGAGQVAAVRQRLAAMERTAADGTEAAPIYRDIGLPAMRGLLAFHAGAYGQAVEQLLPARYDLWKLGGSHAQRDIIDWTLTEAAIRAGQRSIALSLCNERLAARPRSIPNRDFHARAEALAA